MSWAGQYVGIDWVAGESDCWMLARRIWREQFELDVPVIDAAAHSMFASMREFAGHQEYTNWHQVEVPEEGDAVLMGKSSRPSHVGIWSKADDGVVHSVKGSGVILSRLSALHGMGLRVLAFYRRNN